MSNRPGSGLRTTVWSRTLATPSQTRVSKEGLNGFEDKVWTDRRCAGKAWLSLWVKPLLPVDHLDAFTRFDHGAKARSLLTLMCGLPYRGPTREPNCQRARIDSQGEACCERFAKHPACLQGAKWLKFSTSDKNMKINLYTANRLGLTTLYYLRSKYGTRALDDSESMATIVLWDG